MISLTKAKLKNLLLKRKAIRNKIGKQFYYYFLRLSSIMSQSVVFIKKNQSSENLSSPKNMRKSSSFLRFSLSRQQ